MSLDKLKQKLLSDPDCKEAYDQISPEFDKVKEKLKKKYKIDSDK